MLELVDLRETSTSDLRRGLPRPKVADAMPIDAVRAIIEEVRLGGDEALRSLTKRFDRVDLDEVVIAQGELEAAYHRIDPTLREALEAAHMTVRAFHRAERESLSSMERFVRNGMSISTALVPVDRAGCYVPGGLARYPSSVIMTAGIAREAGVNEVVVCVPPSPLGAVDDATLAAAFICSVDQVVPVGGAQAIAAMAYGTESIAPVDVISGPGNIYVSVAKREVANVVGVPSAFAGPSEVVVVADHSVDPALAAVDVAVQAEHGPDGLSWLITWDESYIPRVREALESIIEESPRRDQIASTLQGGGFVALVRDRAHAIEVANFIAPEHLELLYDGASEDLSLVRSAGAVFVGRNGTAAFGDYVAGPSHVLPTFGTARFSSALGVSDFLKRIHMVEVSDDAPEAIGWAVEALAKTEGLAAHGKSVAMRRRQAR
ncbi:MAG: histidinol dehydrogenase [Acidimicrobiales bacterium]